MASIDLVSFYVNSKKITKQSTYQKITKKSD